MATQKELQNWFTHHPPTARQLDYYETIRTVAKGLAEQFNAAIPDCADKTAAMRKLRETVMAMNLAIACYQSPTIESLQAVLDANEALPVTVNHDGSISVDEA